MCQPSLVRSQCHMDWILGEYMTGSHARQTYTPSSLISWIDNMQYRCWSVVCDRNDDRVIGQVDHRPRPVGRDQLALTQDVVGHRTPYGISRPSGVLMPSSTPGSTSRSERGARNRSWRSFNVSRSGSIISRSSGVETPPSRPRA